MEDAELCFLWVNDPDVARYLGLVQAPVSIEHERTWIAGVLADATHQRHFVILDERARPIGACGLRRITPEEGIAQLGVFIGDRADWGKGYGTAATRALLEHAFTELGLQEVRLSCHADNRRAIRCYQKAGLLASQHRLETSTFGRHEVRMAITRQRWEEVRGESA
jgi:RimJ/RimL family protein N-acetyltransferase